jgi:hypothetical protein
MTPTVIITSLLVLIFGLPAIGFVLLSWAVSNIQKHQAEMRRRAS